MAAAWSCATLLPTPAAEEDAVAAAMRDALYAEEVKGDPATALKAYEAVTARFEEQRDLAATALYRQAECLRKLDRPQDAAAVYRKVLLLFPDKDRLARLSRENLTALGEKAPDSMPAAASGDPTITEEEQKELARVKAMAANSPDLIFQTMDKFCPFLAAANDGHATVLEWLLTTHPDEAKPHLTTALRAAVSAGRLKACEKLIAAGAKLKGMLSLALENQRWSVFRLLLASKADPNEPGEVSMNYNSDGTLRGSLLMLALASRQRAPMDIVAAILQAGVHPNEPGTFSPQNGSDALSVTPLELATRASSTETLDLLIKAKADVNRPCGSENTTPLLTAFKHCTEGQLDAVVEVLVAAGADWTIPSSSGQTTLHLAAFGGHERWVNAALKAGIDPNVRTNSGVTPLRMAQSMPNGYRAVPRLLEAGAKVNATSPDSGNPFAQACEKWPENPEALAALAALVNAGASVNATHDSVGPPLQAAMGREGSGGRKIVEFLLANGAKPEAALFNTDIHEWAFTPNFDDFLPVFRLVWQAANWRDNAQLPNAIWFDDGEASLQNQRHNGGRDTAPSFAAIFSKESALDGVPTLRQVARELVNNFATAGRDWTKAMIKRKQGDGSISELSAFDIVAIAEGKAEPPALQWGDALALAAGDGSQDKSFEPVRQWANAEPAMTVRIDLGVAGVVSNRPTEKGPALWDVSPTSRGKDVASLLRQAGVPVDVLRLRTVIRRTAEDGTLGTLVDPQTKQPMSQLQWVYPRHGDIISLSPPEPKAELTTDDVNGGIWLCESEQGPFWPVDAKLKEADKPSLGYLLLALQAPHPGPFQSIDWARAAIRTGSSAPELLLPVWRQKTLQRGITLILPPGEAKEGTVLAELRRGLESLTLNWTIPSKDGAMLPRMYRPRFFARHATEGGPVWTDDVPASNSGPLVPLAKELVFSDTVVAEANRTLLDVDYEGNWAKEGALLRWVEKSGGPPIFLPSGIVLPTTSAVPSPK